MYMYVTGSRAASPSIPPTPTPFVRPLERVRSPTEPPSNFGTVPPTPRNRKSGYLMLPLLLLLFFLLLLFLFLFLFCHVYFLPLSSEILLFLMKLKSTHDLSLHLTHHQRITGMLTLKQNIVMFVKRHTLEW